MYHRSAFRNQRFTYHKVFTSPWRLFGISLTVVHGHSTSHDHISNSAARVVKEVGGTGGYDGIKVLIVRVLDHHIIREGI